MKAVSLAGGLGTRISEETVVRPKPMVEIGGKPILWHIMKQYSQHGFDDFVVAPAPEDDVDDAKAPPNDEGALEERLDLLGRGIRSHVEILGPKPDQQVPYCATDDVALEAGLGQGAHDPDRAVVDEPGIDAVLGLRHLDAPAERNRGRRRRIALAEQLLDESLDHLKSFRIRHPRSRAICSRAAPGLVATGW